MDRSSSTVRSRTTPTVARNRLVSLPRVVLAREASTWGLGNHSFQLALARAEGRNRSYEQAGWMVLGHGALRAHRWCSLRPSGVATMVDRRRTTSGGCRERRPRLRKHEAPCCRRARRPYLLRWEPVPTADRIRLTFAAFPNRRRPRSGRPRHPRAPGTGQHLALSIGLTVSVFFGMAYPLAPYGTRYLPGRLPDIDRPLADGVEYPARSHEHRRVPSPAPPTG